ncbi:uncharacterized protein LOC116205443 [Punica granatum]|uniref:Uncharacterized protein n=2 Tax=Punica granatum TaxID=22663 RepID=A0A218XUR3_PUNGR|nr:uncharacterized protein LOC116205443 [Punica granatum]OWM88386.1 hypothetical protein CDL15_Pgr003798 [Punica granatum]PKI49467.1 hypothetical protein CRG98_030084 [Punica granatum]
MASGWVKSLQCKSRAFEDVYQPHPKALLAGSSSCRKSAQTLKDVVDVATQKARKTKPLSDPLLQPPRQSLPALKRSKTEPARVSNARHSRTLHEPVFPALTELPEGHPSRNVVEIIFHTGWSPKAFSGRVEMIFKVQNGPRAVAHFEEYREGVKARAARASPRSSQPGDENARCAADGNEVMRFRCMGAAGSGEHDSPCGAWALQCKGGKSICTFSGSGRAHESAGGGRGRRAMLVCRVIAGRVGFDQLLEDRGGYDSLSGENGELVVFDSRAVLPCFLIIYRL